MDASAIRTIPIEVRSVSGGRMVKWKGRVTSIAPAIGLFGLAIGGNFALPEHAIAANECGAVAPGTTSVTCSDPLYNTGIHYNNPVTVGDFGLTLDNPAMVVTDPANPGNGRVENVGNTPGTLSVHVKNVQQITSTFFPIQAVNNGSGNAFAELSDPDVVLEARGAWAPAMYAHTSGAGTATAVLNDGVIKTFDWLGVGVYAHHAGSGDGDAIAIMNGGAIDNVGTLNSYPVIARNQAGSGRTVVEMNGGEITSNNEALQNRGLYARSENLGAALIRVTDGVIRYGSTGNSTGAIIQMLNGGNTSPAEIEWLGGTLEMNGGGGNTGLRIYNPAKGSSTITVDEIDPLKPTRINLASDYSSGVGIDSMNSAADATVNVKAGQIDVSGKASIGVNIHNAGTGNANFNMTGGSISATGVDSIGVFAHRTDGVYNMNIDAGSITGGSGNGAALWGVSKSGMQSAINIGQGAVIDGSASGLAIRDGDLNRDGVDENGGDVTINIAGQVKGDIVLGRWNDTVNLTDGFLDGDIYGDDKVASAKDGDDTFNWTGGRWGSSFFGQNGSDTVNISTQNYDGMHHVLDGGDDTSAADGWIDQLTFSGIAATANGDNIQNWEIINLKNSDFTLLDSALKTGTEPGTGLNLEGSQLHTNNNFLLDGNVSLDPNSIWTLNGPTPGASTVSGSVDNAGTITTVNGIVGDTITVAGDYVSNDGKLLFDVDTTTGKNDRLQIGGNASGNGLIDVNNIGGSNPDIAPSFKLVQVDGKNDLRLDLSRWDYVSGSGAKSLALGAYGYSLGLGPDGNWYLDSANAQNGRNYQPGVPVYESYAQALLNMNGLPTLQQRVGNRYWYNDGNLVISEGADAIGTPYAPPEEAGSFIQNNGVWGRVEGIHNRMHPETSTSSASYDIDMFKMQAGLDGQFYDSEAGKLIGGVTVQYGRATTDVASVYGNGDITTDGYGFGGTLTWYGTNGFYLDGQAQVTWYDSDLSSQTAGRGLASGNSGFGYALSLEAGKRIELDSRWTVTPQAQLVYSSVGFDSFNDAFGARVSLDRGESLNGRLGLAFERQSSWKDEDGRTTRSTVYGIGNLYYEFLDGTQVNVAGVPFISRNDRLWGGVGLGGTYNWADDKYSVYGEASINTGLQNFADSYALKGTAGFRVKW